MNSLCFYSDRLQEYRQKHRELKAAVRKELGFDLISEPVASETMNGGEKSSDQETGCGKEAEDRGSPVVENASEGQQEQPVEETRVESDAMVPANGHVVESAELDQHEEKTDIDGGDSEDSDRVASGAEVDVVNGGSEVRAAGEEAVNGEINGAFDTTASPSALKSKGTWADVVSKAAVANGTGDKDPVVNGVADNVTVNGVAEE